MHNELINIYSHLVLAVVFLLGECYIEQYLIREHPKSTNAELIAFYIFMSAVITCLSFSATQHTSMNQFQYVEPLCLRLDMLGVVISILEAILSWEHTWFSNVEFCYGMFTSLWLLLRAPILFPSTMISW